MRVDLIPTKEDSRMSVLNIVAPAEIKHDSKLVTSNQLVLSVGVKRVPGKLPAPGFWHCCPETQALDFRTSNNAATARGQPNSPTKSWAEPKLNVI